MLGRARSAVEGDMKTEMVAITQMRNEQHVCSSDGRWYAFGRGVAEWPECWLLALGKQRRLRAAICKARQVLALTAFVCASDGRWYAFGRGVAEWPGCWLLALGKQRRLRAAICKTASLQKTTEGMGAAARRAPRNTRPWSCRPAGRNKNGKKMS